VISIKRRWLTGRNFNGEKGKRGGGVWELPDDLDCQDCHTKEFGNLNHIEAKKEVVTERLGNVDTESALGMPVEKALVSLVNRLIPILTVRFWRSAKLVEILETSGYPVTTREFVPVHLAGLYRASPDGSAPYNLISIAE
tara:strand:+ start:9656 stop:10075 length:420 start_codon:yes stop_codon:yes gene_type:complete